MAPRIGKRDLPPTLKVEIVRSFNYKLNVGSYESRDFFCSQKAECMAEDADDISDRLYQFCRGQVLKAVNEYRESQSNQPRRTA